MEKIVWFIFGSLLATLVDMIQYKKMKDSYEAEKEKMQKDIKILKGSKING